MSRARGPWCPWGVCNDIHRSPQLLAAGYWSWHLARPHSFSRGFSRGLQAACCSIWLEGTRGLVLAFLSPPGRRCLGTGGLAGRQSLGPQRITI